MIRRPPRSTRTDTRFPYTTLFRSEPEIGGGGYDRYHGFPLCSPYPCKGEGGEVESFRGSWRKCRATCIETADLTTYQPVGMSSRMTTRSEEHTTELQSLMRISYAVLCLKKITDIC